MISCKEYVMTRKEELKEQIASCERAPKLCVIQIGDDPASNSYIKGKKKDCEEIGVEFEHIHIKDYKNFSMYNLVSLILRKNEDSSVDGIIVQLPIPAKYDVKTVQRIISKWKDVDGFGSGRYYTPCTPKGIIDYLEYNEVDFSGKLCTVIGRSEIVGKPLVNLLIDRGATVISCNSKTPNVAQFTRTSDIVISAIGKANYFDFTYFSNTQDKPQILIDVGINRDAEGKLCGDITRASKLWATLATPVPNGVGLLTRLALLENTIKAYTLNIEEE